MDGEKMRLQQDRLDEGLEENDESSGNIGFAQRILAEQNTKRISHHCWWDTRLKQLASQLSYRRIGSFAPLFEAVMIDNNKDVPRHGRRF